MIHFSTFKDDFEAILRGLDGLDAATKRVVFMEQMYQYVHGLTKLCYEQKQEALGRVAELEKRLEAQRQNSRQQRLI